MGARAALDGLPLAINDISAAAAADAAAEAKEAGLDLRRAVDLLPLLDELSAPSRRATEVAIAGVADTLDVAAEVEEALAACPALSAAAGGRLAAGLPTLRAALRTAIPPGTARLCDDASPELRAARDALTTADADLHAAADSWAARLFAAGAAERRAVAVRRDRLCIPVRTPRKGELPRGSVTLAASASGATSYCEPADLVALNNASAAALAAADAAEAAMLDALSAAVAAEAGALRRVVAAVASIDLAAARARHAIWCGGVRPTIIPRATARVSGAVLASGVLHPLLLARSLSPLLPPPGVDADAWAETTGGALGPPTAPPRGVDLTPPPGTAVVTVTGPNTGGKTVALKTLGLLALLAAAGASVPVEAGSPVPAVAVFHPVLADVGDPQSLKESLSTFSGRVRRAGLALGEARAAAASSSVGPTALVLLDELGAGTDPAEGAALAAALLDALAPAALLTAATTHARRLKGDVRQGRADAAVEFDAAQRRPTYRLKWGVAGASSALAVAEGLGYDPILLADARVRLADRWGGRGGGEEDAALAAALEADAAAAAADAAAAAAEREAAEADADAAAADLDAALEAENAAREARGGAATAAAAAVAAALSAPDASLALDAVQAAAPAVKDAAAALGEATGRGAWAPATGDRVRVPKAGGGVGVVVRPPAKAGGAMAVRVSGMTLTLKPHEVEPVVGERGGSGGGGATPTPRAAPKPLDTRQARVSPDAPAIKTLANTIDVRGLTSREAVHATRDAVGDADDGDALFILHGLGTGALRKAVRAELASNKGVGSYADDGESGGGVTLVRVRRRR